MTGDLVLVLHGGAGRASVDGLVPHLEGTHRVIAPTHPGFDGTEHLASVADLARSCLDMLDGPAAVVGVSFGGWVAAEMAVADRARRIARLVLIDAIGPDIPGHTVTMPAGRGPGPDSGAMAALQAYTGPDMRDPALLDRVGHLDIPALLVWGENDTVVSPDFGRAYAAAFRDARFELIPGAGHLPMREAPERTYAALDVFLSEDHRRTSATAVDRAKFGSATGRPK
ncbi:alpha/beta fold hydrolase [Paractinoplanes atraurantiacus]|uniref:Pimeloyl-ACP methyl ester carboxylesterase n=1 Tax=Paractinoplanes atraurantiacus TaxID=1036182 RepID=A0A285IFF4_9ACTN|nr:alpha/beta fold hydrolase [Actinoplanes atraurantiacus]SNY45806.1 Pimeloyl-ACP methyl ester carboxylesterase [Actinoplanes atraurantiacus]